MEGTNRSFTAARSAPFWASFSKAEGARPFRAAIQEIPASGGAGWNDL
jgi:hypothetical protein